MENRTPPMSRADWEALLKENFAGWSTMDPEKVRHMYDHSSVSYFFDMGHLHRDFDEYARAAAERLKQFSSFEVELKELLSVVQSQSGDMVTTVDICTVRMENEPTNEKPLEALHTVVWRRHPDGRWLIVHEHQSKVSIQEHASPPPPYYITKQQELELRSKASQGMVITGVPTSPVIGQSTSFDDYVRQLMIPTRVLELARKASSIRFSAWETEAIRASIAPGDGTQKGLLRQILEKKAAADASHPPYIRVACTGRGAYDDLAARCGYKTSQGEDSHMGDFGSPIVLELWPAQHYSPMHSHGNTTGIIYCLAGQIDVMFYDRLAWDAKKEGLVTLTPGQCAWLDGDHFAVHKVYCPMDGGMDDGGKGKKVRPNKLLNNSGNFAATFHVYLNQRELPLVRGEPKPEENSRDEFTFVDEKHPHKLMPFTTYSDLSWSILRQVMADRAAR